MKHVFAVFCPESTADRINFATEHKHDLHDEVYARVFLDMFSKQLNLRARLDPSELSKDYPEDSIIIDSNDGELIARVCELHPDTSTAIGKMIAGYLGFANNYCIDIDNTMHFVVTFED